MPLTTCEFTSICDSITAQSSCPDALTMAMCRLYLLNADFRIKQAHDNFMRLAADELGINFDHVLTMSHALKRAGQLAAELHALD
jgi:hypothetical protein